MVLRENKNNAYANLGRETKSIMVFSEVAHRFCTPPEPRVEMFGNEFRWGKTKVFNPSGLKMAAV